MSDGNFNRALLPSTPYASGLRMGRQQMKTKAMGALVELLKKEFPDCMPEDILRLSENFEQMLR